jgi:hypothetical protein
MPQLPKPDFEVEVLHLEHFGRRTHVSSPVTCSNMQHLVLAAFVLPSVRAVAE